MSERKTARHAEFFAPVDDKGKWHARRIVVGTAACGVGVLLDATKSITVEGGTAWSGVHPIICRRCLKQSAGARRES